jgi:hypothetical protein
LRVEPDNAWIALSLHQPKQNQMIINHKIIIYLHSDGSCLR